MKFLKLFNQTAIGLLFFSSSLYSAVQIIQPSENAYEEIQEALILAEPGDVIRLTAGIFHLQDSLSLDIKGVQIEGEGMDQTILNFSDQQSGAQGLSITSDNVTLQDFSVQNAKGDAIKAKGYDGIVYRNQYEVTADYDGDGGAIESLDSYIVFDANQIQLVENNPNLGNAYLLIARLYASSANSCGSDEFEKKMVYVAALNKAIRARSVDPSISDRANSYIKSYSASKPDKTLIFTKGKTPGTSFRIGCWIGETVTIPN